MDLLEAKSRIAEALAESIFRRARYEIAQFKAGYAALRLGREDFSPDFRVKQPAERRRRARVPRRGQVPSVHRAVHLGREPAGGPVDLLPGPAPVARPLLHPGDRASGARALLLPGGRVRNSEEWRTVPDGGSRRGQGVRPLRPQHRGPRRAGPPDLRASDRLSASPLSLHRLRSTIQQPSTARNTSTARLNVAGESRSCTRSPSRKPASAASVSSSDQPSSFQVMSPYQVTAPSCTTL